MRIVVVFPNLSAGLDLKKIYERNKFFCFHNRYGGRTTARMQAPEEMKKHELTKPH